MQKLSKYKLVLTFLLVSIAGFSKNYKYHKIILPPAVCYGLDSNTFTYILPPDSLILKSTQANPDITFNVTYNNMTAEAKNAFEYAVTLWENYLKSPVPVEIYVSSESLGSGVLASAATTSFNYNFEGAQPDKLYPVSLMEKMLRQDINGDYDIDISVSNDESIWYYGTDGNTPINKYDFVSVMLHEIAHGLGFVGTMKINDEQQGEWGLYSRPTIFDNYVQNGEGEFLINEFLFKNPSMQLKYEYTSNDLFFYCPLSLHKNPEYGLPKLYTPSTFNKGSSIYHLDDDTYPAGNINSLMTHATGKAEAIHVPGPLTVNMLEEMGWNFTYIDHIPHKDIEDISNPVFFISQIESDNPPVIKKNYLFYKNELVSDYDSILCYQEENEDFIAEIQFDDTNQVIQYFIKSIDNYGIAFTKPVDAPDSVFSFYIGNDTILPVLQHDPILLMTVDQDSLEITAKVDDNLGIKNVVVEYTINGGEAVSFEIFNDTLDIYNGYFNFTDTNLVVGDLVEYRFIVTDLSRNQNTAIFDNEYMSFRVEETANTITEYSQDFNQFTSDFLGIKKGATSDEDVKFRISLPDGFTDMCLHTPNPYKSPEINNQVFEYITQLRFPVRLKSNAALKFDEIVLVEPGNNGSAFGTTEFWDYVIVEASKDNGKNWYYLQPGYDARKNSTWINTYLSLVDDNNNSKAVATPAMYISNRIDIYKNPIFEEGDEVLFRFRLYSDPYANGWGWAIDNLYIQTPLAIKPMPFDNAFINIYPNPVSDILSIGIQFEKPVNELIIYLNNIYGHTIRMYRSENVSDYNMEIEMNDLPTGLYFLVLNADNERKVKKIIKK